MSDQSSNTSIPKEEDAASTGGSRPTIQLSDLQNIKPELGEDVANAAAAGGKETLAQHSVHVPRRQEKISFTINFKDREPLIECMPHDKIGVEIKKKILQEKINTRRSKYEGMQLFIKDAWVNPGIPAYWIRGSTIDVRFHPTKDFLKSKGNFSDVDPFKRHISFVINHIESKKYATNVVFEGKIRVDCLETISFRDSLVKDSRFKVDDFQNFILKDINTKKEYSMQNTCTSDIDGKEFIMKIEPITPKKKVDNSFMDDCEMKKGEKLSMKIDNKKMTQKKVDDTDFCESQVKKEKVENSESQCGDGLNVHPESQHACLQDTNLLSNETITIKWAETSVCDMLKYLEENTGWIINPNEKDENKREIFRCRIEKYSSSINVSKSIWLTKQIVEYSKDVGILIYNNGCCSGTILVIGHSSHDENYDENRITLYIMTNSHVYEDSMKNSKSGQIWGKISFSYEQLGDPVQHEIIHDEVILLSSDQNLDYAFLKITRDVDDEILEDIDGLGQYANKIEAHKQDNLQIVGHAGGQIKNHDVGTMFINPRFDQKIVEYLSIPSSDRPSEPLNMEHLSDPRKTFYNCSSFHGASGSPVFNSQGDLVLMHMAGVYFDDKEYKLNRPSYIEFGVQLSSIVEDIQDKVTKNCAGGLDWETLKNLFPKLCMEEPMETD